MSMRLEYCKLGEVIHITSGKECPPEKKTKTKTIPIMGANGIIGNSVEFLYDSPIILVGRVGSCGEVHRVDFPCWPSDNTLVITPKNYADFDYIEYCLRYGDFYPWISGSTQPLLTQTAVKRMEIPWPANEIREKIGNYGRKIDEMIISNSELNAYAQELISALFRSWFIDFDPVKAKAEGELPYGMDEETAALFPHSFEDSELGPIPTGWRIDRIDGLIKRLNVGKKYDQWSVHEKGSIPVLDQGKKGIIGYHNETPGVTASLHSPVVIFCNHTCLVKLITHPFSAIQNVLPFVGHSVDTTWAYFATRDKQEFTGYKGHWPDFIIHKLVVPPEELTKKFGQTVSSLIALIEQKNIITGSSESLRDFLLPLLMSGEISIY